MNMCQSRKDRDERSDDRQKAAEDKGPHSISVVKPNGHVQVALLIKEIFLSVRQVITGSGAEPIPKHRAEGGTANQQKPKYPNTDVEVFGIRKKAGDKHKGIPRKEKTKEHPGLQKNDNQQQGQPSKPDDRLGVQEIRNC